MTLRRDSVTSVVKHQSGRIVPILESKSYGVRMGREMIDIADMNLVLFFFFFGDKGDESPTYGHNITFN